MKAVLQKVSLIAGSARSFSRLEARHVMFLEMDDDPLDS
jgi:hypothetical protein